MKKLNSFLMMIVLLSSTAFFSGCARGEDDPWFTIHSRDARITQPWILTSLSGTIVETVDGNITNIDYEYDGTNLYVTTNGTTVSYAYVFDMQIKDNGEVFSEEFINDIESGDPVQQSSKSSYWYWGNDDKNKTSVVLDLTGYFADYVSFDIPRLAWNDMSLSIDYSDNYTTTGGAAGSKTVLMQLDFEINTALLN